MRASIHVRRTDNEHAQIGAYEDSLKRISRSIGSQRVQRVYTSAHSPLFHLDDAPVPWDSASLLSVCFPRQAARENRVAFNKKDPIALPHPGLRLILATGTPRRFCCVGVFR